jgi:hypothetical protein
MKVEICGRFACVAVSLIKYVTPHFAKNEDTHKPKSVL